MIPTKINSLFLSYSANSKARKKYLATYEIFIISENVGIVLQYIVY
jgi:hypothetical protein